MTLWGEPLKDEDMRTEAIDTGEYDEEVGVYMHKGRHTEAPEFSRQTARRVPAGQLVYELVRRAQEGS